MADYLGQNLLGKSNDNEASATLPRNFVVPDRHRHVHASASSKPCGFICSKLMLISAASAVEVADDDGPHATEPCAERASTGEQTCSANSKHAGANEPWDIIYDPRLWSDRCTVRYIS